ncbi:MAG: ROK family protein [Marinilabiliales bacterium]|nr:MAG: ROK family protein [Marinilabiliales bacterium]
MAVIGMDLGGTKLSAAIFSNDGVILKERNTLLQGKSGEQAGDLITGEALKLFETYSDIRDVIISIGICVPGIYHASTGRVWAPNIPGWEDFPLRHKLREVFDRKNIEISIDSDRACYILGETWKGTARNCRNAIFLSVGTGIGAGILCDGRIIRGHSDIAGAVGWLAMKPEFNLKYSSCGFFEYHTSGEGLIKMANQYAASENPGSTTVTGDKQPSGKPFSTTREVFGAYEKGNTASVRAIDEAIVYWGMTAANLVSIFNPEVIVFGGGVFGPASRFLKRIREEAEKWAQPISISQVRFETTSLGGGAGLAGAGRLALMAGES